jgi:hypothetical protein
VQILAEITSLQAANQPRIDRLPASDVTPYVEVGFDERMLPKAGIGFVWVLESEMETDGRMRRAPAGV